MYLINVSKYISTMDLQKLKLPENLCSVEKAESPSFGSLKKGVKFLKGPVPLTWLVLAGGQSGKALHVGITLWFLRGLNKCNTFPLSMKILRDMGVEKTAGYRGLKQLEKAGLVSVKRKVGRLSIVTVLEK
jgi:hypothetical protein